MISTRSRSSSWSGTRWAITSSATFRGASSSPRSSRCSASCGSTAGHWMIDRFRDRFKFERLSDIAAIPLIIVLIKGSMLVLGPVANAYSRFQEREADCFALELTRTNRSASLAFAGVQRVNLINPRPSWFYRTWRATHPSIGERIDFCNSYHPWDVGRHLRLPELDSAQNRLPELSRVANLTTLAFEDKPGLSHDVIRQRQLLV